MGSRISVKHLLRQVYNHPIKANAPAQTANKNHDLNSSGSPAAVVDGQVVTESEVEAASRNRLVSLRSQEYTIKRQAVDDAINRILLQKEAAREGLTVDQLTQKEITGKIRPATEEQIRAIYDSTKDKYGDKTEPEILKDIEKNLKEARINFRRSEYLKDLRSASRVQIFLEPPRVKINADDGRSRGPQDAPITIVEFADFQCPFCNRATDTLKQVEQIYPGRVRVVFRDFPLSFHPNSAKAAEAASCAQEQGKFWQMHDKLFANQSNLKVDDLKKYAGEIGLDIALFNRCLDSDKYSAKWKADEDDGQSYGINGTPTFFVNGRMLAGAAPLEKFVQFIDEELQRLPDAKSSASTAETLPTTSAVHWDGPVRH